MILVVGGAGYLGSCVVDYLEKEDARFRVLDNLLYLDEYRKDHPFHNEDVTNQSVMCEVFDVYDTIIWLAALVGDGVCMLDPERAKAVNQDAVEYLARNYKGRVIYTSTCSVYGYADGVVDEDYPVKPLSIYAETKLAGENALRSAGSNATILRLGTLHGTSWRMRFDLVVNAMTRDAYYHNKVTVLGGEQRRPLLSVHDAANTIVQLAVDKTWVSGTFNLASQNVSIADLGNQVAYILNVECETIDMPTEDRRDYAVSSAHAIDWFGFDPKFTTQDSIVGVYTLLGTDRLKNPFASRYNNQEAYSKCQQKNPG